MHQCSNYVLPALAQLSLTTNVFDQDNSFCNDFEKTILHEYEKLDMVINSLQIIIVVIVILLYCFTYFKNYRNYQMIKVK